MGITGTVRYSEAGREKVRNTLTFRSSMPFTLPTVPPIDKALLTAKEERSLGDLVHRGQPLGGQGRGGSGGAGVSHSPCPRTQSPGSGSELLLRAELLSRHPGYDSRILSVYAPFMRLAGKPQPRAAGWPCHCDGCSLLTRAPREGEAGGLFLFPVEGPENPDFTTSQGGFARYVSCAGKCIICIGWVKSIGNICRVENTVHLAPMCLSYKLKSRTLTRTFDTPQGLLCK